MIDPKKINKELSYYKNSEFKWVRELYIEFENYFDEKLRPSLKVDFTENEIRELFLLTLDQLYRILSNNYFYWYEDFSKSIHSFFQYENHPSNKKDTSFNRIKVQYLFYMVSLLCHTFVLKISKKNIDYYKLKADEISLKKAEKMLSDQISDYKKEYEGLFKNHLDANTELRIAHDKLKIRRKNKKAQANQNLVRVEMLEKLDKDFKRQVINQAEKCRFNNGKINYSKLGRHFSVDHKTAQNWCKRYQIKTQLIT